MQYNLNVSFVKEVFHKLFSFSREVSQPFCRALSES